MSYNLFAAQPSALQRPARAVLAVIAFAALTACHPSDPKPPAASTAPAPDVAAAAIAPAAMTPVAYIPPTADALYQMVAPIALYPDKLVALVLAGAIHPDEVTSAYNWLAQNPQVQPTAVNQQPWDPSIKSLTTFPNALNLMQSNLPWTTALGQAYNNDPTDVLNAIQVMRQRAQQAGHLQSNTHLRVTRAVTTTNYTPNSAAVNRVYSGPAIVAPPAQYIAIEPAQPQTVYLPSYDPRMVYGSPVAYYEGYHYRPPVVAGNSPVAIGALAFGAGIAITAALDHHDWGWHSWDVHWGDAPAQERWHRGEAPLPAMAQPAVTYQQSTYVSHVNNVSNVFNVSNVSRNNTVINNNYAAMPQPGVATAVNPTVPNALSGAPPTLTQDHHGAAALAGATVAGTALGAMALHHAAKPSSSAPMQSVPVSTPSLAATNNRALPHSAPPAPTVRNVGMPQVVPGPALTSAPNSVAAMPSSHANAASRAPTRTDGGHFSPQVVAPTAPIQPTVAVAPQTHPSAHVNSQSSVMSDTSARMRPPTASEITAKEISASKALPIQHPVAVAPQQHPVIQPTAHQVPTLQPITRPAPALERHATTNVPAPQHPHAPPAPHGEHKDKGHR